MVFPPYEIYYVDMLDESLNGWKPIYFWEDFFICCMVSVIVISSLVVQFVNNKLAKKIARIGSLISSGLLCFIAFQIISMPLQDLSLLNGILLYLPLPILLIIYYLDS